MSVETEKLCPTCKTGKDSYLLDERNPFCPYLHFHNGTSCKMYQKINKSQPDTDKKS